MPVAGEIPIGRIRNETDGPLKQGVNKFAKFTKKPVERETHEEFAN